MWRQGHRELMAQSTALILMMMFFSLFTLLLRWSISSLLSVSLCRSHLWLMTHRLSFCLLVRTLKTFLMFKLLLMRQTWFDFDVLLPRSCVAFLRRGLGRCFVRGRASKFRWNGELRRQRLIQSPPPPHCFYDSCCPYLCYRFAYRRAVFRSRWKTFLQPSQTFFSGWCLTQFNQ